MDFKGFIDSAWNWIKKAFVWMFSDWKNLLVILFATLAVLFFLRYRVAEKKYSNAIIEKRDTISYYENKCGDLYAASEMQITTIKDLKKLNSDLSKEVKNLKDHPLVVVKTEYVTKTDTLYINNEVSADTTDTGIDYKAIFRYDDQWCSLDGQTVFSLPSLTSTTALNSISFSGSIYTDIIEKNKKLYMVSRSDNPYLQINSTEGYMLSPEQSKLLKKRFNRPWGVMGGVGVSATVIDNKVRIVPTVSIIVGYKFISF